MINSGPSFLPQLKSTLNFQFNGRGAMPDFFFCLLEKKTLWTRGLCRKDPWLRLLDSNGKNPVCSLFHCGAQLSIESSLHNPVDINVRMIQRVIFDKRSDCNFVIAMSLDFDQGDAFLLFVRANVLLSSKIFLSQDFGVRCPEGE